MKKSGGDRLKRSVYESTAIPISTERIHACVEKQYRRTKPSPRGEGSETRIPSSKKSDEAANSPLNLEP